MKIRKVKCDRPTNMDKAECRVAQQVTIKARYSSPMCVDRGRGSDGEGHNGQWEQKRQKIKQVWPMGISALLQLTSFTHHESVVQFVSWCFYNDNAYNVKSPWLKRAHHPLVNKELKKKMFIELDQIKCYSN